MGGIVKHTDLSSEEPGPRASVDNREFRAKLPLGGELVLKARTVSGSRLNWTLMTVALVTTGCICTGTLSIIGAPTWVAAGALLLPVVVYSCLSRRGKNRQLPYLTCKPSARTAPACAPCHTPVAHQAST